MSGTISPWEMPVYKCELTRVWSVARLQSFESVDWAVVASLPMGFWSVCVSTCSVQPGRTTGRLAILSASLVSSLGSEVCPPCPAWPGGQGQEPPAFTGGFGPGPWWRSFWEEEEVLGGGVSSVHLQHCSCRDGRGAAADSPVHLLAGSQCGFCPYAPRAAWCHLIVSHTPSWLWLGRRFSSHVGVQSEPLSCTGPC